MIEKGKWIVPAGCVSSSTGEEEKSPSVPRVGKGKKKEEGSSGPVAA